MRYIRTTLTLLFIFTIWNVALGAADVKFTVKYICSGTMPGYDHITKMILYSDGVQVGESTPKLQSIQNSITVYIPSGSHLIKGVLYAKVDTGWEERTKANDYSFDCIWSETILFSTTKITELVFDLDKYAIKEDEAFLSYSNDADFLDGVIESSAKKTNETENVNANKVPGDYKAALKKLNNYLKTFDKGYYGHIEVKDGYIYNYFRDGGNYNKYKMEDIEGAIVQAEYQRVIFKCKGVDKCIYSTWNTDQQEYSQFLQDYKEFNYQELANLLNDFKNAYLDTKNLPTENEQPRRNQRAYTASLDKLNNYLKTFDGDRYQGMELKDGYLISNYKDGQYSKAKLEDIDEAIISDTDSHIKLRCKNDGCIYSTITSSYHDYFNFQSKTVTDLTTLKDLLNNFVIAAKESQQ